MMASRLYTNYKLLDYMQLIIGLTVKVKTKMCFYTDMLNINPTEIQPTNTESCKKKSTQAPISV